MTVNLTRRSLSHMLVGSAAAALAVSRLSGQAGQSTTTAPHENMSAPEPISAADRASLVFPMAA